MTYLFNWIGKVCPQAGVSLKDSYVRMMSEVSQNDSGLSPEEKSVLKKQVDVLATKSVAGSEDCLHLAVFTPKVILEIIEYITCILHMYLTEPKGVG